MNKMTLAAVAVISGVLFAPFLVFAQSADTLDDDYLATELTRQLKKAGYVWEVEAVEITAQAQSGDVVNPLVSQRFNADVVLTEDLYVESVRIDDVFAYITVKQPAGIELKLHGTVSHKIALGAWETNFMVENLNILHTGMTRAKVEADFKDFTVVADNDPGADRVLAEMNARLAEKQAREHQASIEAAEAARQEAEAMREMLREVFLGQWVGKYTCSQGVTELTIMINDILVDNTMTGEFVFYPVKKNNETKQSGRYELTLRYEAKNQTVSAQPGLWLDRLPGYRSVGFTAELRDGELVGTISSIGCETLEVRKLEAEQ